MSQALVQALCSKCNKLSNLETCFECNAALCRRCVIEHFERWKDERIPECERIERDLEGCKRRIDTLNPMLNSNLEAIKTTQDQVEAIYNSYINVLNQEKNELMFILNDLKKQNTKFFDFKNELNKVSQNLMNFRQTSVNLFDDNAVKSLVKTFSESLDVAQNANYKINTLLSQPIKVIDKFDKHQMAPTNARFIGRLESRETNIADYMNSRGGLRNMFAATDPLVDMSKLLSNVPTCPPASQLKNSSNVSNFQTWVKKSSKAPYMAIQIDKMPEHLTSHGYHMFCVDDRDVLSVFTISSQNEFEHKKNYELNSITSIKSIAANSQYFALTFADLPKKHLKKYKSTGILLYKRDRDLVKLSEERVIYSDDDQVPFQWLVGIALNEQFVFVTDKELKTVNKIDLKTGKTLSRIELAHGTPYKLSLNRNFLVLTENFQHTVKILDLDRLNELNSVSLESNGKNGPYSVYLSEDNLVFTKNMTDTQLMMLNGDLKASYTFTEIKGSIRGFTMLECSCQTLVVGVVEKKGLYKLVCFNNLLS